VAVCSRGIGDVELFGGWVGDRIFMIWHGYD
jgi:hypothetical protein